MKRVIYLQDDLNVRKYILRKEYEGFGIYQEKTPTGFFVHQSWAISNGTITLMIPSYNHYCEEEILDFVDNYRKTKLFGTKAINYGKYRCVHPCGNKI